MTGTGSIFRIRPFELKTPPKGINTIKGILWGVTAWVIASPLLWWDTVGFSFYLGLFIYLWCLYAYYEALCEIQWIQTTYPDWRKKPELNEWGDEFNG